MWKEEGVEKEGKGNRIALLAGSLMEKKGETLIK